jgi:hypothetical protein
MTAASLWSRINHEIEIAVRAGLPPEECVNAPATVEPE